MVGMTPSPCIVVNIKTTDTYDVYCGRPGNGEDGTFGNPYVVGRKTPSRYGDYYNVPHAGRTVSSREEAVKLYADYLQRRVKEDERFRGKLNELVARAKEKQLRLGCFCVPRRCHAEHIATWVVEGTKATTVD